MGYNLEFKDRYSRHDQPAQASVDPEFCNGGFRIFGDGVEHLKLSVTNAQFNMIFGAAMIGAELIYPDNFADIMLLLLAARDCPITGELPDEESDCANYLPSAPFVSYYPQDPYNQPDYIPDDYLVPPFFVNSAFEYPELAGYKATDVFVSPSAINIDPIDLATLNLPQIKISVVGSGQIELDLLAVALGSQAVIKVGGPPNLIDIIVDGITEDVVIIDLNVDSVSIPPETDIVYSEEINIEAEAGVQTDVYIVFVPNVDDSIIPIRYGGGIRQIGLCGFESEAMSMGIEDIRFTVDETLLIYKLQKRVLGVWQDTELAIEVGQYWDGIQKKANDAWLFAYDLMQTTEHYSEYEGANVGFTADSPLKAYIDAAGAFDPTDLEASILAAQNTANDALASATAANDQNVVQDGLLSSLQTQIDNLDARLDSLEQRMFTQHWDFKVDNYDFAESVPATWTFGLGFEFEDDMILSKASSTFRDGRIVAYRLELRNLESGERAYNSKIVGDTASAGVLESGLNIRYHKIGNLPISEDFEIEITCDTGAYQLEGLTIYGYGTNDWFDD